jgi:hypothetical protein
MLNEKQLKGKGEALHDGQGQSDKSCLVAIAPAAGHILGTSAMVEGFV